MSAKGCPTRHGADALYIELSRGCVTRSRRAAANKIQGVWEKSVGKLRPLLAQIEATDKLIDRIVYELYGLADEEIKIVEGRP